LRPPLGQTAQQSPKEIKEKEEKKSKLTKSDQ
jgi:hypothetical protein